jgi:hypothetical protein
MIYEKNCDISNTYSMKIRVNLDILRTFQKCIAFEKSGIKITEQIVYKDNDGVLWNNAGWRMIGFVPIKIEPIENTISKC